jgi:oligopeptidase A
MTPREPNPLREFTGPPAYDRIRAEHGEPAARAAVEEVEQVLERVVAASGRPTWGSLVAPLEDAQDRLDRCWSAIENLEATLGTEELRAAHRAAQDLVTRHKARIAQDERLWRAEKALADDATGLDAVQRKILDDHLRDFRLAGVHLPAAAKERCLAIRAELADLGSRFADHATDDALRFRLVLDRPEDLAGLPGPLLAAARARALADDPAAPEGRHAFALDQTVVAPFLAFQRNRGLRETLHRAWVTRASAAPYDNGPLALRILALRKELASLLGFANYAELSLARKMARSPDEVRGFLLDLADRALPRARAELAELADMARRRDGVERLERHDLAYYREILRRERHGFSQEDVRPWFPLPRVLEGLSGVLRRLYGIDLRDRTADGVLATWHADVRVLEISDAGTVLGHILFDPYVRPGKRAGAWVSGLVTRQRRPDGTIERPVAHLVCNFPAPAGGRPALLAHDDVRTLFHEMGHALHHVLTEVDHRAAAGIRGVPWDGVEFPSQFHENWVWQEESLALLSGHVETGEPLPAALLAKMRGARTFLAATDLLRQVELALLDLELHTAFDPAKDDLRATVESVRRRVAVVQAADYDRFENSFLHVFQGGYAAGYYGYKWAEVLAADAFGRFEEEGPFSASAARDFRGSVLARGGSEDFLGLFVRFRGRAPDSAALLRQAGIA